MVYLRVTMVDCGRLWEWCECPSCEQVVYEATRNEWDLPEGVTFDLVFEWAWAWPKIRLPERPECLPPLTLSVLVFKPRSNVRPKPELLANITMRWVQK